MNYPKLGKVPETKNHYVALCEAKYSSSKMVGVQHFVMKQVSPGINVSLTEVRKITPPTTQTPPVLSSTSSASVPTRSSSSLQPIKKKQTSLDKLFPKKRKFAEESEDEEVPHTTPFPKKRLVSSLVSEHPHSRSETLCFPNDIANYVNVNSLTDEQKYNVLCNVWVPSTNFPFPLVNGRRFRLDWMKLFPWLTYSQKLNGVE
jgi:hypothetical protein